MALTDNPHHLPFDRQQSTQSWIILFFGTDKLGHFSDAVRSEEKLLYPLFKYMRDLADLHESLRAESPLPSSCGFTRRAVYELEHTVELMRRFPETRDILHAFSWMSLFPAEINMMTTNYNHSQELLFVFTYFFKLMGGLRREWWFSRWLEGMKVWLHSALEKENQAWMVEPQLW